MNIEELRDFCISLPHTTEDFPFDQNTLVFKVGGKIYLLTSLAGPFYINLKCDPGYAIELRESYASVRQGYHMNKKHWNTLDMDGSLTDDFLRELIEHSYQQVIKTLTKKARAELLGR